MENYTNELVIGEDCKDEGIEENATILQFPMFK